MTADSLPDLLPFEEWCDGRKFLPITNDQLSEAVTWLYDHSHTVHSSRNHVFNLLMEVAILRRENASLRRDLASKCRDLNERKTAESKR